MFAETLLHWQSWKKAPRLVMAVLMEDGQAALWHDAANFLNEQRWIINERDHPAAPGEIVIARRQIIGHQIQLVNFHIRERARPARCFHRADEVLRALERDDFTCRADNFGKIDGRISRAGTHIQDAFANCEACALPAI